MLHFSFHFAKCVFAKLMQLRLGHYIRSSGSEVHLVIANVLGQYFALPLLKAEHMKPQIQRLEAELEKATRLPNCSRSDRRKFNKFHRYIVRTWMIGQGPETVSVFGARHKTNNTLERLTHNLIISSLTDVSLLIFIPTHTIPNVEVLFIFLVPWFFANTH